MSIPENGPSAHLQSAQIDKPALIGWETMTYQKGPAGCTMVGWPHLPKRKAKRRGGGKRKENEGSDGKKEMDGKRNASA